MLQLVLEFIAFYSLGRQGGLASLDMLSQFMDLDCFAFFCLLGLLILGVDLFASKDECLLEAPKVAFKFLNLGLLCLILVCEPLDIAKGWETSKAAVGVVFARAIAEGRNGDGEGDGSGDSGIAVASTHAQCRGELCDVITSCHVKGRRGGGACRCEGLGHRAAVHGSCDR